VLLAGCSGQRDLLSDPFLGTPAPPRPADPGLASAPTSSTLAPAPAAGQANGVPPLPNTHTMTSPAALVGGPTPAGSGGNMRIGETSGTTVSTTAPAGSGTAPLHGPEPSGGTERAAAGTPGWPSSPYQQTSAVGSSAPAASGAGDSFDHLMDELRKRGVDDFWRLEYLGGGVYHFRCMVPSSPDNRNLGRNYEVRVPGANGLAAIRAVLDQIDHDRAAK
jgi:hypothetical protein